MQLPLDRRTGFVKGYALIEYEKKQEAQKAIEGENGKDFMECTITVEWAFSKFSPVLSCFPLRCTTSLPAPLSLLLYHPILRLLWLPLAILRLYSPIQLWCLIMRLRAFARAWLPACVGARMFAYVHRLCAVVMGARCSLCMHVLSRVHERRKQCARRVVYKHPPRRVLHLFSLPRLHV